MSSPDTRNKNAMQDFLSELRTHNSFFKSISADTALDLLKRCEVLIYENEFIYRKGDTTDTCLLVLYGNIALHSTEAGVFKECLMGDTLSEENILLENQVLRYFLPFPHDDWLPCLWAEWRQPKHWTRWLCWPLQRSRCEAWKNCFGLLTIAATIPQSSLFCGTAISPRKKYATETRPFEALCKCKLKPVITKAEFSFKTLKENHSKKTRSRFQLKRGLQNKRSPSHLVLMVCFFLSSIINKRFLHFWLAGVSCFWLVFRSICSLSIG